MSEATERPQGCVTFDGGVMCFGRSIIGAALGRDGRAWRWEFDPRFGPTFIAKNGDPLKVQPCPREPPRKQHPAWEAFGAWVAALPAPQEGKCPIMLDIAEDAP